MATPVEYRGFTITNPGNGYQDWRCTFDWQGGQRTRFGTLEEIKEDCDLVLDGFGLPAKQRGWA